jgi:catechol 2,3-dioxygenase-like lactoylglutathione lyase family enzyme
MKRFHVHVAVRDLQQSVRFYSAMFGAEPAVVKPDYAKWMLEDPRVNFAISQRGSAPGINHLGLQAETEEELEGIHADLQRADAAVVAEKGVHCCYATSDKYWVTDPQGVAWENFRSLANVPFYDGEREAAPGTCGADQASACCQPRNAMQEKTGKAGCCASAA